MILVLLGTFPTAFKRPLVEIDRLCREGKINEKVIVQSGHTQFESEFLEMRPFIAPDELTGIYKEARIVITQAGTGSLLKGMKLHKKIIAIPRLAKCLLRNNMTTFVAKSCSSIPRGTNFFQC
jgi:UDP-N-acetylglucosamine transferase subunit ALG13